MSWVFEAWQGRLSQVEIDSLGNFLGLDSLTQFMYYTLYLPMGKWGRKEFDLECIAGFTDSLYPLLSVPCVECSTIITAERRIRFGPRGRQKKLEIGNIVNPGCAMTICDD